jgi:D-amino-acid dehydrogenase
MRIVVIGGGIIGMFASYYLLRNGYGVTIADGNSVGAGTSMHNGGLIVPSFAGPSRMSLATILGTYLGRQGPVYVSPKEALRNGGWMLAALRHGLGRPHKTIFELGARSLRLYNEFFREESVDVDLTRGIVGLYKDADAASIAAKELDGIFLDGRETSQLGFRGLGGGVLFERELSVDPSKLVNEMRRRLTEMGAGIVAGETQLNGRRPAISSVSVDGEHLSGDVFVIAAGARSGELCKPLGFDPHVLPARGLVITFDTGGSTLVHRSVLLEDYGVVVAQYGRNNLAATGFFELKGFDQRFSDSRKKWLLNVLENHVTDYSKLRYVTEGVGFRPCTPDQIPIVGRVPGYRNLFIATGHCRLGVTLAPGTGDLIKSMIVGEPRDSLSAGFDPARFGG